MIVRHAEKPEGRRGPAGVDRHGRVDEHSLTPRGWQRAGALARLFARPSAPLLVPDYIYAAKWMKLRPGPHGRRPIETVAPLAKFLGKRIIDDFPVHAESALAEDIVRRTGVVLVAWEHHAITALVEALTRGRCTPKWPKKRFDVIWVLEERKGDYAFTAEVPQGLLHGDT
jgi:hypothetical protein